MSSLGIPKEGKKKAAPPKESSVAEAIGLLAYGVYALPALAGYGEHWYLSQREQADIGVQGEAAIASLPDSQAAKVATLIKKYAPIAGLSSTLIVCTYRRVAETRRILEEARVQLEGSAPASGGAGHRAAPVHRGAPRAGTAPEGPRAPRATLTELFERDE
jgi:hypothetical protein